MNPRVGCYALLQWIFPTQGSNQHLLDVLHRQMGSLPLAPKCPKMTPISSLWAKSICLRDEISVSWGSPSNSDSKESTCNAGDLGLIPGLGRSAEEGHSNPLQYSCLENPMDRGAWQATIHRVEQSQTQLNQLSINTHTSVTWVALDLSNTSEAPGKIQTATPQNYQSEPPKSLWAQILVHTQSWGSPAE